MIRYRHLYESENSDIQLYDTVKCAGFEWYVIGIKSDVVTLLIKDNYFGETQFNEIGSNDYRTSDIRKYLLTTILPKLEERGINIISTSIRGVGSDKIYLLSVHEAKKLPKDIRRFSSRWWLRSPSYYNKDSIDKYTNASVVYNNGDIDCYGDPSFDYNCVRPVINIRTKYLY